MNSLLALVLSLRGPLWIFPAAYLLAAIPFGHFLARPRVAGSNGASPPTAAGVARANLGAAIVHEPGLPALAAAILLDAAKGYAAVWLAARFTHADVRWMICAALAAFLGDLTPVWLGFRGERGLAPAAGAFLLICWPAVVIGFSVWLLALWFWGYLSLAAISAAAAFPMILYLLYAPRHAPPEFISFTTFFLSLFLITLHSDNIRRLLAGTEPPFRPGKPKK